ncbi:MULTISPECIES: MFS transporter [Acidiplasma]|jgi:PHS family inorganic phosphate transporter-like MFS transporter|uniref:MFS transporter n=2 Tax=Acidiplasma TaxID=507753 RepID=A0A0Q0VPA7_9ARCH|nr:MULTISPECIES: MFS transporter [Acidiplasma]KJE48889.1 MFS transporter [Acidiplasma sp. MBA-1]KPV46628.1 MFS transporter [Acidiplasma aeolicum]KQB33954.1 MFS transporter [Acidiplasma aeolicum]KQB35470.1 MFS transporter [Acidiplasma cupricumulans]WMT54294.1 MAG: MFS transporter [Acidiplasma sp.]
MTTVDEALDNAKSSKFHYKVLFVSGLGFFTDAYDLFIIGVVILILPLAGWNNISIFYKGLITSTALLSAIIGSVTFGRLLDYLGRKEIYGLELVMLIAGALGSAFLTPTNNILVFILWRFLLGVGIGGDYATSSTIMTEYSNTLNRGKFVGTIFSMQSFGLLAGPLISILFLTSGLSPSLTWRLLLAIGGIPAMLVIYFRRTMPEPPRYTADVRGDIKTAEKNLRSYTGIDAQSKRAEKVNAKWYDLFKDKKFLITLIGTAGTWFLMDWAFYGNSIMSNSILSFLVPSGLNGINAIILTNKYSALIFGIAAFPGYWVAVFTLDKIGRKKIQITGFLMMAISFGIIALFPGIISAAYVYYFLMIYGISYFFIMFGPNVTTFVYPPEVFPISTRGFGTGISAAGGKTGAFIGTFADTLILAFTNLSFLMWILSVLAILGCAMTVFLLPETKGKTLRESSGENRYMNQT